MDTIKVYLEEKLQELERRLTHNERRLQDLPPGSLSIKQIHNHCYLYYETYEKAGKGSGSKKKTRMLKEPDRALATAIRERVQLQRISKRLRQNITILKQFLHSYQAVPAEMIFNELPPAYQEGFDYRGFAKEGHQADSKTNRRLEDHDIDMSNQKSYAESFYPERLIHRNSVGEWYRSKSEVQVSELLLNKGIPYVYEPELKLTSGKVRPDFLIRHPITGRKAYLEYFGMMDDQNYAKKTSIKMQQYLNSGFVPGKDVFFIFEASQTGMDLTVVVKTLDMFLTG